MSEGWSHVWFVMGSVSSGLKHSELSLVTLILEEFGQRRIEVFIVQNMIEG